MGKLSGKALLWSEPARQKSISIGVNCNSTSKDFKIKFGSSGKIGGKLKHTRRTVAIGIAGLLMAGLNYMFSACGATSNDITPEELMATAAAPINNGNCRSNGTSVNIGFNHGHGSPKITAADVTTGIQKTYSISKGNSGHGHTLTLTTEAFSNLQQNIGIIVTTDSDFTGHSHDVTINCVLN